MKVRIFVTPRDVREGRAAVASGSVCENCPLARALSRRCRQPMAVGITCCGPAPLGLLAATLTESMFRFRSDFDRGLPVPSRKNFTLDIPEGWIK